MSFSELLAIELPLGLIILVFILFEIKQMLADFVLQNSWMAGGKQQASGWMAPLAMHCTIHASFTLAIALVINPSFWWLAFVDFVVHFSIDFAKARIGLATGWTPERQSFWSLFGADQACHSLTHLVLALTLIAA
ncbi:MAG: DUF3307 domain-containing protein [Alphaproteobacteria bacterium]|jgi:hypothetical protein|nr:DUF3307 domain-containing protein [Alphaproteobacteria bacterium]